MDLKAEVKKSYEQYMAQPGASVSNGVKFGISTYIGETQEDLKEIANETKDGVIEAVKEHDDDSMKKVEEVLIAGRDKLRDYIDPQKEESDDDDDDEEAIENQKAATMHNENKTLINILAENIVKDKLEEMMVNALNEKNIKVGEGEVLADDLQNVARVIIRGYKTADITQAEEIQKAVNKTRDTLNVIVSDMVNDYMEKSLGGVVKKINREKSNLDSLLSGISNKTTSFNNLDFEEKTNLVIKGIMKTTKIEDGIHHTIGSINNSILDTLNKNPLYREIDNFLGINSVFSGYMKGLESNIMQSLEDKVRPWIEQEIEVLSKGTEFVSELLEQEKQVEEQINNFIEREQQLAQEYAAQYTQKLVNEIADKISISFGGGASKLLGG